LGLRRITGDWRRLHNEELYDLLYTNYYYLGVQIKDNEVRRACRTYGDGPYVQNVLWGYVKDTDSLEDLRVTRHSVKTGLQETGCEGMDWIDLAQTRDK
jgi:hypothetical protein